MDVAVVSMHTAHHEETGATLRTRRVARRLGDRGHDVTLLCAQWWGGDLDAFEHEGIDYRAVTETPNARRFAASLPFALRRAGPDVVHAVNSPPGHVRVAKAAARLLRVPVVVDWWADRDADSAAGYRRAARAADEVVVPSETVGTAVREHGADDAHLRVIPEGIDVGLVRSADVDDRADVVYARDLDAHANVEGFLLALAELRGREWRAAVVGDGPARRTAEQTAAELRIDDRVEFMGDLPPEEFVPVLKGAHVFAHTATRTSFATGLLWALACGCVGIVEYQADSSAHELVEGAERGRLVTSPQELADEIVAAAGLERRSVGDGYADYDHARVLARFEACYDDAVAAYGLF
jgi:glycosyltransferase involved in cell wall biosynthesis